jgi:hypothetical protein
MSEKYQVSVVIDEWEGGYEAKWNDIYVKGISVEDVKERIGEKITTYLKEKKAHNQGFPDDVLKLTSSKWDLVKEIEIDVEGSR